MVFCYLRTQNGARKKPINKDGASKNYQKGQATLADNFNWLSINLKKNLRNRMAAHIFATD